MIPTMTPTKRGRVRGSTGMMWNGQIRQSVVKRGGGLAAALCCLMLLGCHPDMWNQPRFTANQKSDFFSNQSSARDRVPNTLTYAGHRRAWRSEVFAASTGEKTVPPVTDQAFYTGRNVDGTFVAQNYFEVNADLIARGQARFAINCVHCHGMLGDGNGIITKRGFPQAATYHIDRLREVEDGYIVDVVTNGFGRMYSQASKVAPEDRWAIAAYIRALQFSQNADITNPETPLAKEVATNLAKQAADATAVETQHEADSHAH